MLDDACNMLDDACNILDDTCNMLDDACNMLDDTCNMVDDACNRLDAPLVGGSPRSASRPIKAGSAGRRLHSMCRRLQAGWSEWGASVQGACRWILLGLWRAFL